MASSQPQCVSVTSYNVLADRYAQPNSFSYCEKRFLRWNYRKNLLFAELLHLRSDIICLQEVDKPGDFYNFLSGQDFTVTFIKRANKKQDGCMIAFRRSRFSLISPIYKVNFNDLCDQTAFLTDSMRYRHDNIGMIVVLKMNSKSSSSNLNAVPQESDQKAQTCDAKQSESSGKEDVVIVCNCHLFWNPANMDLKLLQIASLMNSIEYVMRKHNLGPDAKIVLAGDFNSQPGDAVYNYITRGVANEASGWKPFVHDINPKFYKQFGISPKSIKNRQNAKIGPNDAKTAENKDNNAKNVTNDATATSGAPQTPPKASNTSETPKLETECQGTKTPTIVANGANPRQSSLTTARDALGLEGRGLRLVVDRDLRKAGRWLAMMGIDVSYFEGQSSTDFSALFDVARAEGRIIVTRNSKFTQRNDCPRFVLIGSRETHQEAFRHVINYFNIEIDFRREQTRDNIAQCLACPNCLQRLMPVDVDRVQDKIEHEGIKKGYNSVGVKLEFYLCEACDTVVYHKEGWLDRLHSRRQGHFMKAKGRVGPQEKHTNDRNANARHAKASKDSKCLKNAKDGKKGYHYASAHGVVRTNKNAANAANTPSSSESDSEAELNETDANKASTSGTAEQEEELEMKRYKSKRSREGQVCKFYMLGKCKNQKCGFVHSTAVASAVCKYYKQGYCSRGDKCAYLHGSQETANANKLFSNHTATGPQDENAVKSGNNESKRNEMSFQTNDFEMDGTDGKSGQNGQNIQSCQTSNIPNVGSDVSANPPDADIKMTAVNETKLDSNESKPSQTSGTSKASKRASKPSDAAVNAKPAGRDKSKKKMASFTKNKNVMQELNLLPSDLPSAPDVTQIGPKLLDIASKLQQLDSAAKILHHASDVSNASDPSNAFNDDHAVILTCRLLKGQFRRYDRIFALPLACLTAAGALNLDAESSGWRGMGPHPVDLGVIASMRKDGMNANGAKRNEEVLLKLETNNKVQIDGEFILFARRSNGSDGRAQLMQLHPVSTLPGSEIFPCIMASELRHNLKLKSCYKTLRGDEPLFSNYTKNFCGCLDYIFVAQASVEVKDVLGMPKFCKHVQEGTKFVDHVKNGTAEGVEKKEEQKDEMDAIAAGGDGKVEKNEKVEKVDKVGKAGKTRKMSKKEMEREMARKEALEEKDAKENLRNFLPDKFHPSDHLPVRAVIEL